MALLAPGVSAESVPAVGARFGRGGAPKRGRSGTGRCMGHRRAAPAWCEGARACARMRVCLTERGVVRCLAWLHAGTHREHPQGLRRFQHPLRVARAQGSGARHGQRHCLSAGGQGRQRAQRGAVRVPGGRDLAAACLRPQRRGRGAGPWQCGDVALPGAAQRKPRPVDRRLRAARHVALRAGCAGTGDRHARDVRAPGVARVAPAPAAGHDLRHRQPLCATGCAPGGGGRLQRLAAARRRIARAQRLREVFRHAHGQHARSFPAGFPLLRLDRIYTRGVASAVPVPMPRRPWARLSDHAPLAADIQLETAA